MTVSTVDQCIMLVNTTMDRKVLSQVKAAINLSLKKGRLMPETFKGINKDIRDRADWLRSRK